MRHRFRLGPGSLLVSVAVVVLGIALVMGGVLTDDTDLDLGALGSTTTEVPISTTTSTLLPTPPTLVEQPTSVAAAPSTTAGRAAVRVTTTTIRPPVSPVTAIPTTKATTTTLTVAPTTTTTTTKVPTTSAAGTRQASVEAEVVTLTNRDRSANGVGALTRNSCMDNAAAQWAGHMARTGEKAHSTQSGPLVQGCRGADAYWGDNIGWWDPCSAAEMENWWMNSPGHRSNVLSTDYTVIGVAAIPGVQGYCWFQVLFSS